MLFFLLLCHVLEFCLLQFAHGLGAGLRFSGAYDQRAEFDPWDFSTNGTISFLFQTHIRSALLLYQDSKPKGNDYLDVFLVHGVLRLRFYLTFCKNDPERIEIQGQFSDSKWHNVSISLDFQTISFSVDSTKKSKVVFCQNNVGNIRRRRAKTLFLGGLPIWIGDDLNQISNPNIVYEYYGPNNTWFKGCIGDLMYRKGSNRPVKVRLKKRFKAEADCENACSADQTPAKCSNRGLCIDHILYYDCDCKGTGYEGSYCTKASSMIYLNGTGYIYYRMLEPNTQWSMKSNRISFRVVPLSNDGVILYVGKEKDRLLVEMVKGKLQVNVDLGGGQVIMRSNTTLNISQYHFVEITRRQKKLSLDINRGWVVQSEVIPGSLFSLDLKGSERAVYFGGGPGILPLSTSKQNFSGFLQELKFDKFKKVLDRFISQNDKRFGYVGGVYDGGRDELKRFLPQDNSIAGSGCGELSDDEDNDNCQPTPEKCLTPECIFGKRTTTRRGTIRPLTMASTFNTENGSPTPGEVMSQRASHGPKSQRGVSLWIIIVIVAAAVVAVLITIILLYRWNIRYSGSFKPSLREPGDGVVVEPVKRGYEQPAFYVSPNKPKEEEAMA